MFDFVGRVRQIAGQVDQLAVLIHVKNVFDPYSQFFFRDVDSGFKGKYRPRSQRNVIVAGIVDIQSDVVAKPVNEVFSQRLAVKIFAVSVDVVVGNIMKRIGPVSPQTRLARAKCGSGGLLRAEDDVVNLPLPSGELAGQPAKCE